MRPILHLTWLILPHDAGKVTVEAVADLLSGYAADLRKGMALGEPCVTFQVPDSSQPTTERMWDGLWPSKFKPGGKDAVSC